MSNENLINVRGVNEQEDPFYRYKMEKIELIKQGSQFVFTNVDNISLALHREPQQLVSFLKKYFASAFIYKNNVAKSSKTDLTAFSLQEAIYQYIETDVLCKKCKLPETVVKKDKKKTHICCQACGHKLEI